MENSMEFIELQQLKTRIDVLNRKLEGQKLLNDRIVRRSITANISRYNLIDDIIYLLSIILGVPMLVFIYCSLHLPWSSGVALVVIMLCEMLLTYYSRKKANLKVLIGEDIILFGKNVLKMKISQTKQLYFFLPAYVLWICWFVYDVSVASQEFNLHISIVRGIIGLCIGMVVWYFIWRKQQRFINETLNQIEELTSEK